MRSAIGIPSLTFVIKFFLIFSFQNSEGTPASSPSINVKDSGVDIGAEQVPLIEILKEICTKAGSSLKADDSLTQPVSLHLNGVSVETGLRHLLANRNYTLLFKNGNHNQVIPVELSVVKGSLKKEGSTKRTAHRSMGKSRAEKPAPPRMIR